MILNFNCMDAAFLPEELHFGDTIIEWYWSTCVQGYGGCFLVLILYLIAPFCSYDLHFFFFRVSFCMTSIQNL